MKQIIDELKTIPGVLGAALYGPTPGLIASNLPSLFKADRLAEMGKLLAKILSTGRMNFPDTTEVTLYYDESVVIVREVSPKLYLFALCEPSFNLSLLTMSFNLVEEELKHHQEVQEPQLSPVPGSPVRGADLLETGPLAELLREMQRVLSKIVGPMAQILFEDALDRWVEKATPSRKTLPELLDALSHEISDAEKVKQYRELVAPELQRAGATGV